MVFMLDLKTLGQQSAILPYFAEKNHFLSEKAGDPAVCHRHVNYNLPVGIARYLRKVCIYIYICNYRVNSEGPTNAWHALVANSI